MGYVYRYRDIEDNIIKYVGIVWSDNRTLLQRAREHYLYDDWCHNGNFEIEYIEVNSRTDCECLEGHFISVYSTDKWYNKGKSTWGMSDIYSKIAWKWEKLQYKNFDDEKINRKNRITNKNYLLKLCENSVYVFNSGKFYCFFSSFKKEPIYVFLGLDDEYIGYALENNIRYMDRKMHHDILCIIDDNHIPFGYSKMLGELEQTKLESNLTIEQCFTSKKKNEIKKILKANGLCNNFDEKTLIRMVDDEVDTFSFVSIEDMQSQKSK